ncbi:hypothetical protein [Treponema putidum]|uniref:hypothetical protein n=1 Tax=Treponema putidum TaxID=221027 RepID=UPI00119921D5|nr:hypothetical protein [Treponema putidum]TWI77557.1 hypothetical protein JM98_01251 [Treponema putidum]UTY31138.1 hypothetical protein E4N75_06090 [Treponema putidum]
MSIKNKKIKFLLTIFLINGHLIFAQNFSVPYFENTNILYGLNDSPYVTGNSLLTCKLRIEPSHILYFDMDIDANIDKLFSFFSSVEDPKLNGNFRFKGASINFPQIKNKPISLGIFTGIYDTLGSDSILQEHLKIKMPDPEFRKYYPVSAFRPQNFVKGTGAGVYGTFSSGFYMGAYISWNEKLKDDLKINSDFRMGGAFGLFAFDFFAGAAFPMNVSKTKLRTGIAALFQADDDYDFFTEAGVAEIKLEKMDIKDFTSNFYASFEARIKKDFFNSAIACFVSPIFLLPQSIQHPSLKDSFFTGISTNISFGNIETYNMQGGLFIMGSLNPLKPTLITPFSLLISPFYTVKIKNLELDFRFPINPLSYNETAKIISGQISIKAVY